MSEIRNHPWFKPGDPGWNKSDYQGGWDTARNLADQGADRFYDPHWLIVGMLLAESLNIASKFEWALGFARSMWNIEQDRKAKESEAGRE